MDGGRPRVAETAASDAPASDVAAADEAQMPRARLRGWRRIVATPRFQAWAARFPLTRGRVRRDGEDLMRLVAGFVDSQVLAACVELGLLDALAEPLSLDEAALAVHVPAERLRVLLDAAAALGLIRHRRGRYRLARRGAALLGVPGLTGMIAHHRILYRDLADPAAFFRGGTDTDLARFWPYVLGGVDAGTAARYSALMADSQALVAAETLATVDLAGVRHLIDVGGGTGAFLQAVAARYPAMALTLADLPAVIETARPRLADVGLGDRVRCVGIDFRARLPAGADAASLVRVLYDHGDATVAALLARVRAGLPPGGRVIVAEPMLGTRATDTYFAVYTLAMGTGRTRSPAEIAALLDGAGFADIRVRRTSRPFVTGVVEGRVPTTVVQD